MPVSAGAVPAGLSRRTCFFPAQFGVRVMQEIHILTDN